MIMKMNFLRDKFGKPSMMRLGFLILIIAGCIFSFFYPDNHVGYLGIIGLAVGMKWAQKRNEGKEEIFELQNEEDFLKEQNKE